jgi:uncharacterized membrane protein YccC
LRILIGPTLTGKKHAFGSNAFAIEATDGTTTQKARPTRKHEPLAACRFENQQVKSLLGEDTEWKETFDRLAETAPAQTWEPLLAALHTAELETATDDAAELHQQEMSKLKTDEECHHTDSRVLCAHVETEESLNEKKNHCGNDASIQSNTTSRQ